MDIPNFFMNIQLFNLGYPKMNYGYPKIKLYRFSSLGQTQTVLCSYRQYTVFNPFITLSLGSIEMSLVISEPYKRAELFIIEL